MNIKFESKVQEFHIELYFYVDKNIKDFKIIPKYDFLETSDAYKEISDLDITKIESERVILIRDNQYYKELERSVSGVHPGPYLTLFRYEHYHPKAFISDYTSLVKKYFNEAYERSTDVIISEIQEAKEKMLENYYLKLAEQQELQEKGKYLSNKDKKLEEFLNVDILGV